MAGYRTSRLALLDTGLADVQGSVDEQYHSKVQLGSQIAYPVIVRSLAYVLDMSAIRNGVELTAPQPTPLPISPRRPQAR
jgi:hypothetical protein